MKINKNLNPVAFCNRLNKIHRRLNHSKRVPAITNLLLEFEAVEISDCPLSYLVCGKNISQNTETLIFEIQ